MSITVTDRLDMLHRLLEATENSMPESEDDDATRAARLHICLSNVRQITLLTWAIERDLADALNRDDMQTALRESEAR